MNCTTRGGLGQWTTTTRLVDHQSVGLSSTSRPGSSTKCTSTSSRYYWATVSACSTTSAQTRLGLEITRVVDSPAVTHLRYRIVS